MRNVIFQSDAFDEFLEWAENDKKMYQKIGKLIKEAIRNPFDGVGKPEPLKGDLKGLWSRRINDEHRLVYKVNDTSIIIVACRYHYSK